MNVPIGTIFERGGVCGFWKVIGPKRSTLGGYSYPVIKCTKTGKEFKTTNGFRDSFVEQLYNEGKTWKAAGNAAKVSTVNEASGARKRRIRFIISEIAAYTKELEELNKLENA